jgi:HlyD family secretion protein
MKIVMKSKLFKITLILVLCGVGAFLLISAFKPESAPVSENQVVAVQRGDLTIDITGSGNLVLSLTEDLAFEMAGTVEEVMVEEGESVEEGQVLAKLDTSEWDKEVITLERDQLQAEINLENAELALDKAEEETTTTVTGDIRVTTTTDPKEIKIKELQVELAEARLEDAQEALEEALNASPEVTAPFDGFITKVNVDGGDEVKKGTVAVTIADPNRFEADILVSEMDIMQVKLGGEASVQVDALQGMSLPAEVTHISPTATIQQGVVNYQVKVEVQPLETVMQGQQQARQQTTQQTPQGQGGQQWQVPTAIPEDFQLREGLTVTVSIIVDERNDVVLVPNGAITSQGRQTYVQVVAPDGTIEQRAITTGISDWQYTEVTDGLSEGEQVVVPQGTATTSTTQQPRGPGGEMFFFRGGGP